MTHGNQQVSRVVILGGSGFAGRHLRDHLQTKHADREVISLSSRDLDLADPCIAPQLAEYFNDRTAVVVCAGIKSNYGSNLENCTKNITIAANVCRAMAMAPPCHVIFFSSIAVYGVEAHNTGISEGTAVIPDTHYGLSKFASEAMLTLETARHRATSLAVLRMPTMYGPGETLVPATPSGFLTTYVSGGEVTLFGDGSELREFVFIGDVVRIVDRLIEERFSGLLNIGAGAPVSYRNALDVIGQLLNRKLTIRHVERTKPRVDKVYDTTRLQRLMPDFQFTSLREGLEQILATLRPRMAEAPDV